MKPIYSIAAPTRVGVGLGVAAALAVGLMQVTADRLVDGNYDQAIAVASSHDRAVDTQSGLLRLAAHSVIDTSVLPTAATEHAWLTRSIMPAEPVALAGPVHVEPLAVDSAIGTSVGARFKVVSAGHSRELEVVDVREVSGDFLNGTRSANAAANKFLLVSCNVVGEAAAPAGKTARVMRFLVDAGSRAADPVKPRAL
jgi:hypothetical protein